MTYHTTASRRTSGHRPNQDRGQNSSPRIAISLPDATLKALARRAEARAVPIATVIREAIDQYLGEK